MPNELFSPTNVAGIAIATAAVTVATNAIAYMIPKIGKKYTAFVFSLIIAYLVLFITKPENWYDWVLAFFNACLLYCSALGINQTVMAGSNADSPQIQNYDEPEERSFTATETMVRTKTKTFFQSWF